MKLKYIFMAFAAVLGFAVACEKQEIREQWDEIQVSNNYVVMPMTGGPVTITVTASDSWTILAPTSTDSAAVVGFDRQKKNSKTGELEWVYAANQWLTLSQLSGNAGETELTLTAPATEAGKGTVHFTINCAGKEQYVSVIQGTNTAVASTCDDVIKGPDSKQYRVKGTCTAISNTTYGNWYLQDKTGEIYIYGTLDASGAEKNFSSLGIEVGDVVEVEGPKTTYNGTVELVNVTVVSIQKSLLKVVSSSADTLAKEAGELEVKVAYKGSGVFLSIADDSKSWVTYSDMEYIKGVASKLESSPADTAVVKFLIAANEGGNRTGSINFASYSGNNSSAVDYTFVQEGSIIEATAAEINAAPAGSTVYRLTGYVSEIKNTEYGNLYIKDHSGEVYVYGTLNAAGESKKFSDTGIKAGDIVTVTGPVTVYKGANQLKNVSVEKVISVSDVTVEEFLSKAVSSTEYYRLTGTLSKADNYTILPYGNFNLTDATDTVLVYGCLTGWGGAKKMFGDLGVNEGDTITLVGVRAAHNGIPQVGSAFYVSHESASAGGATVEGTEYTSDFSKVWTEKTTFEKDQTFTNWIEGVTVTYTNNNKTLSNYDGSGVRFYQSDVLTFSCSSKKIVKIEFTDTYGDKTGPVTANTGSVDDTGLVWTGSASEVAITASSQVRFKTLKVTLN